MLMTSRRIFDGRLLRSLLLLLFSGGVCSSAFAGLGGVRTPAEKIKTRSSLLLSLHGGSQDGIPPKKRNDSGELPPDFPRRDDVLIALDAVRQACRVTRSLQPVNVSTSATIQDATATTTTTTTSSSIATVEKADLSPVTVADYAVQALILHLLYAEFPNDGFIAEEDSASLRGEQNNALCDQVVQATGGLNKEETLHAVDLGKSYMNWDGNGDAKVSSNRPSRVWSLDPIDGTKGFLRGKRNGGQYAVALALLEDGIPTIGILGCPNLPVDDMEEQEYAWSEDETDNNNSNKRGCIFVASRGGGCYQLPIEESRAEAGQQSLAAPVKLFVTPNDGSDRPVDQGRFCIGVEKFSDALGQTTGIAQVLHGHDTALDETGEIIRARRIDSQAKHGVIARGGAEWYVRLPRPGYVEWIWDHAAGNVVIEEAGGEMTDTEGKPLAFCHGAKLSHDVRGVLMSNGGLFHKALVDAFARVQ